MGFRRNRRPTFIIWVWRPLVIRSKRECLEFCHLCSWPHTMQLFHLKIRFTIMTKNMKSTVVNMTTVDSIFSVCFTGQFKEHTFQYYFIETLVKHYIRNIQCLSCLIGLRQENATEYYKHIYIMNQRQSSWVSKYPRVTPSRIVISFMLFDFKGRDSVSLLHVWPCSKKTFYINSC